MRDEEFTARAAAAKTQVQAQRQQHEALLRHSQEVRRTTGRVAAETRRYVAAARARMPQ